MSTSVPPRDGAGTAASPSSASTATVLSDESALRPAFDAEYQTLITSARTQLGEAASHAPRIVECAFVDAWGQRASIKSPPDLKAFLTNEVQRASARRLSR